MKNGSPVREAALHMDRIDTHAHLSDPYPGLREYESFDTTQFVSDARVQAEGCRVLYGIDPGAFVRPNAPRELFTKAAELRGKGSWQAIEHALNTAHIAKQMSFSNVKPQETRPFSSTPLRARLAYLAYIDEAVAGSFEYPCPDVCPPDYCFYDRIARLLGELNTLDDYLARLDELIDGWRAHGVVGMKSAQAYTTGLAMLDPSRAEARGAFARKRDMTAADFRVVHDYALRHALLACKRNGLPVVIHTGFQIWGHASLEQANPMHLHPLLVDPRYRGITFVLLHGGNPYVGETTYLAGMFPNVILDFTWIAWMTPARFRQALAEWLACVPHDRICWGSDSGGPESICGINSVVRRLIADVLDECIADRLIDERYAMEFLENAYMKTPKRVFGI